MLLENVVTGLTIGSAVSILAMALFNISREQHSFINVLKHQAGFEVSSAAIPSPVDSATGALGKKRGSKIEMPSESGQKSSKSKSKNLSRPISFAAILTAYQNRAVALACVVGIIASVDPLGNNKIFGLPTFMALTFTQVFSGYIIQCFWCYSWITFLIDFNQVETFSKNLVKAIFYVLGFVNTASTVLFVTFFYFPEFKIPRLVAWYTMCVDWVVSTIVFSAICTQTATKAIQFLQDGKFVKANATNIINLKRKMVSANFSFISAALVAAIPVLANIPVSVVLQGNDLPKWYYYPLMIILPQGWAFILAFNWIWKIEIVTEEATVPAKVPSEASAPLNATVTVTENA